MVEIHGRDTWSRYVVEIRGRDTWFDVHYNAPINAFRVSVNITKKKTKVIAHSIEPRGCA